MPVLGAHGGLGPQTVGNQTSVLMFSIVNVQKYLLSCH